MKKEWQSLFISYILFIFRGLKQYEINNQKETVCTY